MLTKFLVLLYIWGYVNTAVPDSYLKLLDDDDIRQPNWQINQQQPKQNDHRSHLIKNALDLLNKEKNNEKTLAINKCLYKNYELRNRLKCVKEIFSRSNSKRENYNPIYTKYSDEYDDSYEFQDLTKLGRSHKNNKNFSQDYLDISDLLRTNEKQNNTKKRYVLKVVQPNKYNRFDYDLTTFRRFNPNGGTDILRTNSESSESSQSSEENDKLRTKNNVSNKRYDDSDGSSSSEDTDEEGPKIKDPAVIYMQSPSHIYGASSRRRLPHFLPKRFHWTEDEIKDLTHYWFNGPQGKYWGLHRTPY